MSRVRLPEVRYTPDDILDVDGETSVDRIIGFDGSVAGKELGIGLLVFLEGLRLEAPEKIPADTMVQRLRALGREVPLPSATDENELSVVDHSIAGGRV